MCFHKMFYLVILETIVYLPNVLNESIEQEDYKFPVYPTPFCPRNESEWNKRSAALNCNKTNGFTCLPNEQLTELLEFCYTEPLIWVEAGTCLYLVKGVSIVNGYKCHRFRYGCHNVSFLSDRIFEYSGCISLGNGCFLAEPSCESGKFPYLHENGSMNLKKDSKIPYNYPQQSTTQINKENTLTNDEETLQWIAFFLGVSTPLCVIFSRSGFFAFVRRKIRIWKIHCQGEGTDVEKLIDNVPIDEESPPFHQSHKYVIYDNKHRDKKSDRQEVKTHGSIEGKKKNMACQGERNKSQESKTIQAKRPRCGQTETREPITDALTIDSSTPHLSISPESLDALTEVVKNKVLAEIKPLLQQQDNNYFQNMGIKKGAAVSPTGSLDGKRTNGISSAAEFATV